MSQQVEPTRAQLRQWGRRAETIHSKASDLFNMIEVALGEHDLTIRAGMLMVEASGFANIGPSRFSRDSDAARQRGDGLSGPGPQQGQQARASEGGIANEH